jgi:DNA polymerase-3 subunit epsilon
LLDAQLLAEVYLAMTRGQDSLLAGLAEGPAIESEGEEPERFEVRLLKATADELEAHARYIEELDTAARGACVWKKLAATPN